MYSNFKTELVSLADEKYRDFSIQSIPCNRPFIGVRIPAIRKLIKEIPKEKYDEFLKENPVTIEEVLARGFIIARLPYDEMLDVFDSHVKLLDNWCTVDTFCAALRKTIKHHENEFLDKKIKTLLKSKNEYEVRTGLVLLLDLYVKPEYLNLIFNYIESLKNRNEYYIKMAIAWLLAECFIKYPNETYNYLNRSNLDKWTFNKAISKVCDSYRVSPETKTAIKMLKK